MDLALDVAEGPVLEQGGGDEQAVIGRLLHEAHHGGAAGGLGRQRREARVVEAHRDLAGEVLQQVPRQAELREDDEVRAAAPRLADHLGVAVEVRLEIPEAGGDLGEGDPDGLHDRSLPARPGNSNPDGPHRVLHSRVTTRHRRC